MKVNKLLQTQIKRYLPAKSLGEAQMVEFINAISNTYNLYQKELPAAESTQNIAPLSAPHLPEKNFKDIPLKKKKDQIATEIPNEPVELSEEEQLAITAVKNSEYLLSAAATRLTHLFANLNNGILLEDENRKIILANQLYCDSFSLSLSPQSLEGMDCDKVAMQSKHLFKDPYEYVTRIDLLLAAKKIVVGDELELTDGRVLVRDYIPLFIDNEHKGHLWKYEDVTREKENQKALQRLSLVASANENGVIFSDATGAIVWANEGFSKLIGYSYDEIIGQNPIHLCKGPLTDREILASMSESFQAGKSFSLEVIHYRKNGSWFWGRVKGQSFLDDKGNVSQYFGIVEDITREKEKEEQLRVLSLIAEDNINAVTIMDAMGCITWVNKSFIKSTGYTLEDVQGKQSNQFMFGPETNRETVAYLRNAIETGSSFNCEVFNYTKNGNGYWLRIQGQALKNKQGELTGFFSLEEDITHEIERNKTIKEYESRFRKAFEMIGDNVWEHDFTTGTTYLSNTQSHLLGYESEEFTRNKNLWWDRTHKDDADVIWDNNALYKKGEIDHHILEYRVLHKDGTLRWVMDRGVVIQKDENGMPLKVIGTHTDITERKQAEEILQAKEEKYRSIIANMHLGLLEVDINEKVLFTNQSFCDMSGYEYEELIGKKATHIFAKGENIELMESKNEARRKGASEAYEIAVKDKRGQLRWWLVSGATRYDETGDLVGSIGIYLDITDHKQLEIDLIEAREQAEGST
ncbi:MAG: PAS domain-containing protein, partial [Ferruginibacter sp.]